MLDPQEPTRALQELLLELAGQRTSDALLETVVRGVAGLPAVALCRLWLLEAGDQCERCELRRECAGYVPCLHLVASAGSSRTGEQDWSGLEGRFRRFPVGVRKIGHVAATGEALVVWDVEQDDGWIADPAWARREGVQGLIAQPLVFQGEVLGVFGMFLRKRVEMDALIWHRMIADHAAAAIANARAFAEIRRLKEALEVENALLREEVATEGAFGELVGSSLALRRTAEQIGVVADTDATVLVTGESGTGKELVAREIHRRSRRRDRALVKVNCAAVPRELYESEFFGHVAGSFSGAIRDRVGRFEAADGGTLFLDEVGEIPLDLQAKLLRVLQEGTFERVGEAKARDVDVRIVAATNRDLRLEVEAGRFREDLYYRLDVFPIEVPPLRDRVEDIPALAAHFVRQASARMGRSPPPLGPSSLVGLEGHAWPGNIRELRNLIERALITSRGPVLEVELPHRKARPKPSRTAAAEPLLSDAEIRALERANTVRALERCEGRVSGPNGAAALLGLKPSTLSSRMRAMGLGAGRSPS